MLDKLNLEELFYTYKESRLQHRYITNNHIEPLLNNLGKDFKFEIIGHSVREKPIYGVKVGTGSNKILMWSQMHGNESTTTKALFDLFNYFKANEECYILKHCEFCIIPILNPDGAEVYTRVNANSIDLNRDAQDLSQSESKLLRKVFNDFEPNFCFNLHGQRTIFSAGDSNNSATVSFLAPALDKECSITHNRKVAMEVIVKIHTKLQAYIPNQVAIYDDDFNINCVGDTFQNLNVPTILFEAGHYEGDYSREEVRKLMFISMLTSFDEIINNVKLGQNYLPYFDIPENKKLFYDIILRDAKVIQNGLETVLDIAIQYEEILKDDKVMFLPKIQDLGKLSHYHAHNTINAGAHLVEFPNNSTLQVGHSIDFVMINNKLFSLKLTNN